MLRGLAILLRLVSYACLAAMIAAFIAIDYLLDQGLCSRLDEGSVQCITESARAYGSTALSFLLFAFFTGLPALFAVLGFFFLCADLLRLLRWLRRRRRPA